MSCGIDSVTRISLAHLVERLEENGIIREFTARANASQSFAPERMVRWESVDGPQSGADAV